MISNECRNYASEAQNPFSTLDATDPQSVYFSTVGREYNSGISAKQVYAVPHRFYRLTEVTFWADYWMISGIQLKFEVPSNFTGHAPITYMYGSTRLASRYVSLKANWDDTSDQVTLKSLGSDYDGGIQFF